MNVLQSKIESLEEQHRASLQTKHGLVREVEDLKLRCSSSESAVCSLQVENSTLMQQVQQMRGYGHVNISIGLIFGRFNVRIPVVFRVSPYNIKKFDIRTASIKPDALTFLLVFTEGAWFCRDKDECSAQCAKQHVQIVALEDAVSALEQSVIQYRERAEV